jgi:hypothetical protein
MTALRQALADYLAVRRSLGFKLEDSERLLTQFISFLVFHRAWPDLQRMKVCSTFPSQVGFFSLTFFLVPHRPLADPPWMKRAFDRCVSVI